MGIAASATSSPCETTHGHRWRMVNGCAKRRFWPGVQLPAMAGENPSRNMRSWRKTATDLSSLHSGFARTPKAKVKKPALRSVAVVCRRNHSCCSTRMQFCTKFSKCRRKMATIRSKLCDPSKKLAFGLPLAAKSATSSTQ
eukprot:430122-Alexandrium_andersonii.AAC.1